MAFSIFLQLYVILHLLTLLTTSTPKCFQCGSALIEVSKTTTQLEGSLFPQTTSIYRCSNEACQVEKDREAAKRMKAQQDKEKAEEKRAEDRKKAHDEKVMVMIAQEEEKRSKSQH